METREQKCYKHSNGITLVALVITVIVMLILLTISVDYGTKQIDKARLEDLKTDMIAIKGKAKIIAEKNSFDSASGLVGTSQETVRGVDGTGSFYKWSQDDLNTQGLDVIKVTETRYYVVRYFTKDENQKDVIDVEIYFSEGYKDNNDQLKYSLTDIENI